MKFKNIEYLGVGLLVASFIGFWPRYFSKFFDGTAEFPYYFHLHTATATLWVLLLIIQPILIRKNQRKWHRIIGKCSYALVPIVLISAILLRHYQIISEPVNTAKRLFGTLGHLLIFVFGYGTAIIYRKHPQVHARGMIVTGLTLVSPSLGRMFYLVLGVQAPWAFYLGVAPVIFGMLISFIYLERNSSQGRWVFPSTLILFLFYHTILRSGVSFPAWWEAFTRWFVSLPLT